MKKSKLLAFLCVALVLCSSFAVIYKLKSIRSFKSTTTRRLYVEKRELNLGLVEENGLASGRFRIENRGEIDLHIINLAGSCGCIKAKAESDVLPAGRSEFIDVAFASKGHWRNVENQVLLCTDDPYEPALTLTVRSYVRVGIRLDLDRVELQEGRVGDVIGGAHLHALKDIDQTDQPISAEGDGMRYLKVDIGHWIPSDELTEATIGFETKPLILPVGVNTFPLDICIGKSRFPVSVVCHIIPTLTAIPSVAHLKANGGNVEIKLQSKGRDIKIENSSPLDPDVISSIRQTTPKTAVLRIQPAKSGSGHFTTVKVTYRITSFDQLESIDIPVLFGDHDPSASSHNPDASSLPRLALR